MNGVHIYDKSYEWNPIFIVFNPIFDPLILLIFMNGIL